MFKGVKNAKYKKLRKAMQSDFRKIDKNHYGVIIWFFKHASLSNHFK